MSTLTEGNDLPDSFTIMTIEDAQRAINAICAFIKDLAGLTQIAGDTNKVYFGGMGTDNYIEYDEDDDLFRLYRGGVLKREW